MLPSTTPDKPSSSCGDQGVDLALVRAAMAGEERASDALFGRLRCLSRFVAALNQRYGGPFDAHEIADLVQDALLIVWRKLDSFHGPDGLESWVLRIARFEFQNALRKRFRQGPDHQPLERAEEVEGGADPALEVLDAQALAQALAELDPGTERTIRMKHFCGLTFEEIGAQLGCSPNTAKTRYYRGLMRLADALEGGEPR